MKSVFDLEQFPSRIVRLVIVFGLILRMGGIFLLGEIDPTKAVIWEYGTIAVFAMENGYIGEQAKNPEGYLFSYPTAFMPPVPIFVWLGFFKLFGVTKLALTGFLLLSWILSGVLIYQAARIAWYLFRAPSVTFISAGLISCYPTFVASVATYHAIQIYMVLFLGGALLALRPAPANWKTALGLGLLGGLAALARTEYVVLMAPFFLMLFLRRGKLGLLVLSVAVAAAIVLPWTARNYLVFGRFIPVANSMGFNLFKGFNELANGSGDWVDNNSVRETLLGEKLAAVPLDEKYESARDDIMKGHALAYMKANPVEAFVWLPLKKQLLFWTFDYHDPMAWHPAYQAAFWPVFLFTLAGLWAAWRKGALTKRTWIFLVALFGAQAFVISLYAVHLRYRMNVEPFLFPFAAYAINLCLCLLRNKFYLYPR